MENPPDYLSSYKDPNFKKKKKMLLSPQGLQFCNFIAFESVYPKFKKNSLAKTKFTVPILQIKVLPSTCLISLFILIHHKPPYSLAQTTEVIFPLLCS